MAADLATKQVALSTSDTQIASGKAYDSTLYIKNNDAAILVYVGVEGVATTTGYKLGPAAELKLELKKGGPAVWAIAASGTPSVSVLRVV